MNAPEFLVAFTSASSADRAQMLHRVTSSTNDIRIKNILSNINLNDVSKRNAHLPDNIYYAAAMLRSFVGLRLNWR